ncbi:MAG: CNNM domain-containing protein, partial [Comamonas sp.]
MSLSQSLITVAVLIAVSAFFSMAEISLAASRRLRLRLLADEGDARADAVLRTQEQPGNYFTVVQIGQNAIAILGGIVGEGAFSPYFTRVFELWFAASTAATLGFLASFFIITSLFIVFADLIPKRLSMAESETVALRVVGPMQTFMTLFKPIV